MKVLCLFSGGLDSLISTIWTRRQGFEVKAVYFKTPFLDRKIPEIFAEKYNIDLHVVELKDNYLDIVINPKYGWGKGANPCIDCHAMMITTAGKMLQSENAAFIVTGDVVGQRPMSQRKDTLKLIDKITGMSEITVRPLSGKILPKTTAEKMGWIKREELMDISGRGRKRQMKIAQEYGITEYNQSTGGCVLTERTYKNKIIDLIDNEQLTEENVKLLKIGRHFRTKNKTKIILGRNKMENEELKKLTIKEDKLIFPPQHKAPVALIKSPYNQEDIKITEKLIDYYSIKTIHNDINKEIVRI
ncbi:MAG: hypothetical protein APR63_13390 [Desulfuromonas sp. SDB]|nr:MAG: hypothetical protein APR63_13390 [Desulfuromonas sp. SDB]